jgi:hypothetical protein
MFPLLQTPDQVKAHGDPITRYFHLRRPVRCSWCYISGASPGADPDQFPLFPPSLSLVEHEPPESQRKTASQENGRVRGVVNESEQDTRALRMEKGCWS